MCGIVGTFLLNSQDCGLSDRERKCIAIMLSNEMLLASIGRGRDATGISFSCGKRPGFEAEDEVFYLILKQAAAVDEFLRNDGVAFRYRDQEKEANIRAAVRSIMNIDLPLRHVIAHVRARTKGSEYDPLNNHPIKVGNIIGVHNGSLKNSEKLFKAYPEMKRLAEVDSEVIIQLLAKEANERPLEREDASLLGEHLDGAYAVVAYNSQHPEKVLLLRNTERPLDAAYLPEVGMAVLVSERAFLERAIDIYNRISVLNNWPKLHSEYLYVGEESGIIDVTIPVDKSSKTSEIFHLARYSKLKAEFAIEEAKSATTGAGNNAAGSIAPGGSYANRVLPPIGGTTPAVNYNRPPTIIATVNDFSDYSKNKSDGGGDNDLETEDAGEVLARATIVDSSAVEVPKADIFDSEEDPCWAEFLRIGRHRFREEVAKPEGKFHLISMYSDPAAQKNSLDITHQPRAREAFYETAFAEGYAAASAEFGKEVSDLEEKVRTQKTALHHCGAHIANFKNFTMKVLALGQHARLDPAGKVLLSEPLAKAISGTPIDFRLISCLGTKFEWETALRVVAAHHRKA